MSKLNILLTGTSGFVGKKMLAAFKAFDCVVLTLPHDRAAMEKSFEDYAAAQSLAISKAIGDKNIDYFFNFAAPNPRLNESDLAQITRNILVRQALILEVLSNHDVKKVINVGSIWQYSDTGEYRDSDCLYVNFKNAVTELTKAYGSSFTTAELVLFDTIGPDDSRGKVLNQLYKSALENSTIKMSTGSQIMYPMDVRDCVSAILWVAFKMKYSGYKKFWLPGPERLSLRALVNRFCIAQRIRPTIAWGEKSMTNPQIIEPFVGEIPPGFSYKYTLDETLGDWRP